MDADPKRKKKGGRCALCGLHLHLCVCARFPRVSTRAAILVVQHYGERHKPTNTGRLLPAMIEGAVLTPYGLREAVLDESTLTPDVDWHLVFPRLDAPVLSPAFMAELRARPVKPGFVLLDGTWHQCSRMSRRAPRIKDLPCVALPDGPPSRWGVRTQHDPRGLSTFEAGVRLVALLEGRAVAEPLHAIFHELAARLLFMKGKLNQPEVPAQWQSDVLPG